MSAGGKCWLTFHLDKFGVLGREPMGLAPGKQDRGWKGQRLF